MKGGKAKAKAKARMKDWRRVTHSAKVGLALALVSLCVLLQDVFDKLGHNALWAILTVVVIFEYTVGATLSKGLNRGLGTIMAASLGLFVDYMANFTGPKAEPFVVGFSVFVVGMSATYTRFVPSVKAKFDYGVVIFLLTFCLVVISGYQVSDNIDVVFDRIVTVLIGVILCLLISIFIFPVWAGDDLHQLVIDNFQGLANSLEECLKEYFQGVQKLSRVSSKICKGQPFDDKIYKGYRGVLLSKQSEESLANFASWEPRHVRFGCMYPWKRLVEVGAILRHCAYTVSALHGCVLSEIQAPEQLKKVFAASCIKIGEEVANVLRGAAVDLKTKQKTKPKKILLSEVRCAIDDLNYAVRTYPHFINTSRLQKHEASHSTCAHLNFNADSTVPSPSPCINPVAPNTSSNPCINIEVPNVEPISTPYSDNILDSNAQLGKETLAFNGVPPPSPTAASSKEDNKECFTSLYESMEFAESLSLASLITLLIEIVARIEHLLDANAIFQEQAGFKQAANYEVASSGDTKIEVHCTRPLDHPFSTTYAE